MKLSVSNKDRLVEATSRALASSTGFLWISPDVAAEVIAAYEAEKAQIEREELNEATERRLAANSAWIDPAFAI